MTSDKQVKQMQATQKQKGAGARPCFFGTNVDGSGGRAGVSQCTRACLPGADLCDPCFEAMLFVSCAVQCCDFRRGPGYSSSPFCPSHSAQYREWIANGEHSNGSPKEWLAVRPNVQADRLAAVAARKNIKRSLRGALSLGASALAFSFVVLAGAIYTAIVAALLGDLGLAIGAGVVFFFWAVLLGVVVSEVKRGARE